MCHLRNLIGVLYKLCKSDLLYSKLFPYKGTTKIILEIISRCEYLADHSIVSGPKSVERCVRKGTLGTVLGGGAVCVYVVVVVVVVTMSFL